MQYESAKKPLNILWITCDEMRASAVSVYGNSLVSMPGAERLAREGTVFENAFCQMPKCVPSRCSMITGRYAHSDGIRTLKGRRWYEPAPEVKTNNLLYLDEKIPNLISILRDKNYKSCLLGKNHLVDWNSHRKIFDQTSTWNFEKPRYAQTQSPERRRAYYEGRFAEDYPMERHFDAATANETIEFIKNSKKHPFLALVDIGKPHPPYEDYSEMPVSSLDLDSIPEPTRGSLKKAPTVERWIRQSFDLEDLPGEDRKRILRAYYSMCEFADRQVARILDVLDEAKLTNNTLVIYTSDHGDFAGDHGCFEKWDTCFYESIVKVPLIMRLPGRIPASGRRAQLTELVDIFPTILEMTEHPIPESVQGRSFRGLFDEPNAQHRDHVFCEGGVEEALTQRPYVNGEPSPKQKVLLEYPNSLRRAKMIRNDRYKYIYRVAGDCELFDLHEDPEELNNICCDPNYDSVRQEMQNLLLQVMVETETNLPEISTLIA